MKNTKFGIEIEFTGITRKEAARVVSEYTGGSVHFEGDFYDTYSVILPDGRKYKLMRDGSITTMKKDGNRKVYADGEYSVELVSPILTYEKDIETLQEIVRRLRKAGAFVDEGSCGIHIHLNGKDHTIRSIRNFVNIIYSKNDLLYKALQIKPERFRWCQKMDYSLVETINRKKPRTLFELENIWYTLNPDSRGRCRETHYHSSRYHFLNLHSFFQGNHTVELRGFNSTLHAGKIRAYIVLALALNQQALTQTKASAKKPQVENEKFAMRTYLNRIGLIGDEFKNCREHLTAHLEGSAAWRFGNAA